MNRQPAGNQWLKDFIPYLLYRSSHRLNSRLLTRLKAMKINASQWRVLSVLRAYGTLSVSEIVEHTLMEQPTISRIVAQLEQDGSVERQQSAQDTRVTQVSLTPKGIAAFEAVIPAALRHQELALAGMTPEELSTLTRLLAKIEKNIDMYT